MGGIHSTVPYPKTYGNSTKYFNNREEKGIIKDASDVGVAVSCIDGFKLAHFLSFTSEGLYDGHPPEVLLYERIEVAHFITYGLEGAFDASLEPTGGNKKHGDNAKADEHEHRVEEEEHGKEHHRDAEQVAKDDEDSFREYLGYGFDVWDDTSD